MNFNHFSGHVSNLSDLLVNIANLFKCILAALNNKNIFCTLYSMLSSEILLHVYIKK